MAESAVVSAGQWIGSLLMEESNMLMGVKDEIRKLQQELELLREYLRDADTKPGEEARALTAHVRQLAYDAEDLIDSYVLKVNPNNGLTRRHWVVKLVRRLEKAPHTRTVGRKLQELRSEVDKVMQKLRGDGVLQNRHEDDDRTRQSYPYGQREDDIVGLKEETEKLIKVLVEQEEVRVLGITGMGGSGKTTVARKLYNDTNVKQWFDCQAWVFISQNWDTQKVLSEILRQVGGKDAQESRPNTCTNMQLSSEELIDKLRSVLENKLYLVVLDDVWKRKALDKIFPALPEGRDGKGSKIIITTRNQEVVQFKNPASFFAYTPKPLDEQQGWDLLCKVALTHRLDLDTKADIQTFERLGRGMLSQCRGLPLAILALAGILCTKTSIAEWQQVSNAVQAQVMDGTDPDTSERVEQILALSYNDLPHYLKPCFLYLGLFPEDCEIPAGMLTRMWVAEGLVAPPRNLSLEDGAVKHLQELSYRFMVQVDKTNYKGQIKTIRLHDLLRDLSVAKAKEQSFLEVYPDNDQGNRSAVDKQPRRAGVHSSVSIPAGVSHLRSLVLLTRASISPSVYRSKDMIDLGFVHSCFKLLRVLNIWGIKTASGTLPEQVGKLLHLRYLGLRASNITQLPNSIGALRSLLTLDYRDIECDSNVLITIPNVLGKLQQLRHLFLPTERSWNVERLRLSTLENLQTLWGIKQDGSGNKWLPTEMSMLSKSLRKLHVVVATEGDLESVFSCPSLVSDKLQTLRCDLRHGVALKRVKLKPISDLEQLTKLTLSGNIFMDLPSLLPVNLIMLELRDNVLQDEDPMLALGALVHLKLLKLSNFYVGSCFSCKMGSFPRLVELYLEKLENLVAWTIEQGAMVRLKKVDVSQCRKLQFPCGLESTTTLQQLEFWGVTKAFAEKAREYGFSSQKLRMPHKCEAILEQCDSLIDTSVMRRLYKQLTVGVFLNSKRQRYWVAQQGDDYCNCFMVYAKDLSISFGEDDRHWRWRTMCESDGTMITTAEMKMISLLEVEGTFNTTNLNPKVTYQVSYMIKLKAGASGWEKPVNCKLALPDGEVLSNREILHDKPKEEWMKVLVGEVETVPRNLGDIKFSLCGKEDNKTTWKKGLVIKGVIIEPKQL